VGELEKRGGGKQKGNSGGSKSPQGGEAGQSLSQEVEEKTSKVIMKSLRFYGGEWQLEGEGIFRRKKSACAGDHTPLLRIGIGRFRKPSEPTWKREVVDEGNEGALGCRGGGSAFLMGGL